MNKNIDLKKILENVRDTPLLQEWREIIRRY